MSLSDQDVRVLEELYAEGRFAELESRALVLTQEHPDVGLTWSILGAALTAQGKVALDAQSRAAELLPDDPVAQLQYADCLLSNGQLDDAVSTYHRAIVLQPDWAAAHNNLGNAYKAQGLLSQAHKQYGLALECDPSFALAHYNLALLSRDAEEWDDVEPQLRKALEADPAFAPAWVELANVRKAEGDLASAEVALLNGIESAPHLIEARVNLGIILRLQGKNLDAARTLQEVLRLDPTQDDARAELGAVFLIEDRLAEAEEILQQVLDRNPLHPTALSSMADISVACGDFPRAIALSQQYVEADRTRWDGWSRLLFSVASYRVGDDTSVLQLHREFGSELAARIQPLAALTRKASDSRRDLRVGLVSGDFCRHIVSLWLEPVLNELGRYNDLHLVAYSTNPEIDEVTRRMQRYFASWHCVAGMDSRRLAEKIRADSIDILIDLAGHTGYNALPTFAYKPAHVQASWLGYGMTTGLSTVDYYFAEPNWLPPTLFDHWFTEKLVYLPAFSHVLAGGSLPDVSELPALKNGHVTFGSFNHFRKLSQPVVMTWSRLLSNVPGSRILIGAIDSAEERERIVGWFCNVGIDEDRLDFAMRSELVSFLRLFDQVDICLDSFPYPGATTTSYALLMGVPTITLVGESPIERLGAYFLGALGMDSFIAHSKGEFIEIGTHWATRLQELANLRASLRQRFVDAQIANPADFSRSLHVALRAIWARYCEGSSPTSFTVERARVQ